MVEQGLTLVKSVRDRYDGERRNPWNELECGSHYARSLASWSVLLALSGFECDLTVGHIGFKPALDTDNFRSFWSTGTGWGSYSQKNGQVTLRCDYGHLTIQSFYAGNTAVANVQLAGKSVPATFEPKNGGTLVHLSAPLTLHAGETLFLNAT